MRDGEITGDPLGEGDPLTGDIVKALASPLSNVDKITVVSTGNGSSSGMHKITGDITEMAAQVPALFEALSGMKMGDLLGKIRTLGDKSPRHESLPAAGNDGKTQDTGTEE